MTTKIMFYEDVCKFCNAFFYSISNRSLRRQDNGRPKRDRIRAVAIPISNQFAPVTDDKFAVNSPLPRRRFKQKRDKDFRP